MPEFFIFFISIIVWIACGILGFFIGETKNIGGVGGLLLGLFLGVVGILIVYICDDKTQRYREYGLRQRHSTDTKECPFCAETIKKMLLNVDFVMNY